LVGAESAGEPVGVLAGAESAGEPVGVLAGVESAGEPVGVLAGVPVGVGGGDRVWLPPVWPPPVWPRRPAITIMGMAVIPMVIPRTEIITEPDITEPDITDLERTLHRITIMDTATNRLSVMDTAINRLPVLLLLSAPPPLLPRQPHPQTQTTPAIIMETRLGIEAIADTELLRLAANAGLGHTASTRCMRDWESVARTQPKIPIETP
jgi:hypothetical protein